MTRLEKIALTILLVSLAGALAGCGSETLAPQPVQEAPLLPPRDIITTRTESGDILITWQPSGETNLLGYNIYRSVYREDSFVRVNPAIVTDNQYTDTTAWQDKRYEYRVVSVSTGYQEGGYGVSIIYNGVENPTPKHKKLFQ